MTAQRTRFQTLLNIQPGEGVRIAWMILYSAAATGIVMTIGYAVQDALFLSALPPSDTPWLLILPAVGIIFSVLLYGRIAARFRLDHLVIGTTGLLAALFVVFRVLLDSPLSKSFGLLAAIYVFIDTGVTLVLIQFWAFAGEVFNAREAKRLFGLIAIGGTLISMLAGISLGPLSELIGVPNIFFVVIAGLVICALCARVLGQMVFSRSRSMDASHGEAESSFKDDLRAMRRSRLLSGIAGLSILVSVLMFIGIYQFSVSLQIKFGGDDQAMVAFLGAFDFFTNLIALGIQFYLISRVLKRFGVFVALLVFPLMMALSSAAGLLTNGAFFVMALVRASETVLRRTFTDSSLNVLYLPVIASLRQRAIEFNEVLGELASVLLGVAILCVQTVPSWSFVNWSWLALIAGGGWVFVQRWTQPQYQRALADSLKKRTLDFDGEPIDITDPATAQVLAGALHYPDEMYVLQALKLIAAAPGIDWDQHIAPLLEHPSVAIRLAALRQLGRPGNIAYRERVAAALSSSEDEVCSAAIEAYCAIAQPNAIDRIGSFLTDPRPDIRGAAVTGLITYDGLDGRLQAEAALDQMRQSADAVDRREAARAIGLLDRSDVDAELIPLLSDNDRAVRINAVRAAGHHRNRSLLPRVIQLLHDETVDAEAAAALIQYGAGIEPDLAAVLADEREDRSVRVLIPGILRHIGTQAALEILAGQLNDSHPDIRSAVGSALVRLRAGRRDLNLPLDPIRTALDIELRCGYDLYVLRHDLKAAGFDLLLDDTLQTRLSRTLDRIFALLAVLYPNHKVERIRQGLDSSQSDIRANAIELLDNLAEHRVKDWLIPLIESPADEVLRLAEEHFASVSQSPAARLRELVRGDDEWLQACALFRLGTQQQLPIDQVRAALNGDRPLLRETALAVGRSILSGEQYRSALKEQSSDGRFPAVRRYAQAQLDKMERA